MKKTKSELIRFFLELSFGLAAMIAVAANSEGNLNKLVAILVVLFNIAALIKVRNDWYLLVIFSVVVYCNYSICVANYLSKDIVNYFVGYAGSTIGASGVNILAFFSFALFIAAPKTNKNDKKIRSIIKNNRKNPVIVIGLSVLLVLIWYYGYTRPEIPGERGSPSALYEYSIIFFIISLYYSGRDRVLIIVNVCLAAAFAIQNFIYGGRITGIQIIIAFAMGLLIDKFSLKTIIPSVCLLFIIMSGIGEVRANILLYGINFRNIIRSLFAEHFALDTAYSSYFTSMTFLEVLRKLSVGQRLHLFVRWALSMLLGGSVQDSNLAEYTRQFIFHYYGGILPFFGWFYLGVLGVVALAAYLRLLFVKIKSCNCDSNGLIRCVSIYVCSTSLRWYLYSPSQLFRSVMLLCLVYGAADIFYNRGEIRVNK